MKWSWKYQSEKELIITKPVTKQELIRVNCRFCVYACVIDENTFQWLAWYEEKLLVSVNKLHNAIQKERENQKVLIFCDQLLIYILESIPSIDFFYGQNTFRCMQLFWNIRLLLSHQSGLRQSNFWMGEYDLSSKIYIFIRVFSTVM